MSKKKQLEEDYDRVKSGLYLKDGVRYSKERGMGPGMAARRLEDQGVDVQALLGGKPSRKDDEEYKKGGKVMNENMMMKKEGRGMAKANMQKIASKAVKGHEKRMHGMKSGGLAAGHKAADGIATKGKTRCKMV